ncbi:MAG TPA: hypothetical protein VGK46_12090 [Saprospiraceae bacterium]|jgi:hypothetical protein
MDQTQVLSDSRKSEILLPLFSAFLIVNFLFFIDEGYYDFRWMAEWGNWLVFGIYMIMFFPIQWGISHFLFPRLTGWKKIAALVGLTLPLTILLFWIVS